LLIGGGQNAEKSCKAMGIQAGRLGEGFGQRWSSSTHQASEKKQESGTERKHGKE
jgi:hypothetical protein